MGLLDVLVHLLGFVLPALAVALFLVGGAAVCLPHNPATPRWWVQWAVNAAVGVLVLLGGLVLTGRDGKVATYAVLVLAMASSQWGLSRAWRK
jgi:hypothetical protein